MDSTEQNPFEPPSESADAGAPSTSASSIRGLHRLTLYSPNQVALGAFIGSPIAAAWLMAANFKTLGKLRHATKAWWWGVAATVALIGIAIALPEGTPGTFISLAYTFGAREAARRYQGDDFKRVVEAGGRRPSSWRAAGIGLLCMLFFLGVLFALGYLAGLSGFDAGE